MKDLSILKPAIMQALLTFLMLGWMAKERFAAIKAKAVEMGADGKPAFKGRAAQVSNAYHNQFEMPVLFFAAVTFALVADAADANMVMLAWAFVAARFAQAMIHATYNRIEHRFVAFFVSNVFLIAMWIKLAMLVFANGA